MAKFTPDGCSIDFILYLRTELDPCNIRFDLVRDIDNNVTIPDSVISLTSDKHILFDKSPVVISDSTIKILSDEMGIFASNYVATTDSIIAIVSDDSPLYIQVAKPIRISNSVIKIQSDETEFYNFSAIENKESVIKISSDAAELWVPPSVVIPDSIIKIDTPESYIFPLPSVIPYESNILIAGNASVKNPSANDLPTTINTSVAGGDGASFPWHNDLPETALIYTFPWDESEEIIKREHIVFAKTYTTDIHYHIVWRSIPEKKRVTDIAYQDFKKHCDFYDTIPWGSYKHHWDIKIDFSWGTSYPMDLHLVIPWLYPEAKDIKSSIPWGNFIQTDYNFTVKWLSYIEHYVNVRYDIVWGPVDWSDICCVRYYPPPACFPIVFNMKETAIPDVCKDVILSIGPRYSTSLSAYCPYQHRHSGRRDPFEHLRPIKDYILKPREEYDMINTVTVQILPLNSDIPPLEVATINISTDKDSFLWSFSMTIIKDDFSRNFLDLIKPRIVEGELAYTDVLISINQNFWVCRVEGFSESRTFGKDTWQITGRSPSMELGSPQNQKFNYTYVNPTDNRTSGAQIIEDVLKGTMLGIDNTGWVPVFDRYGTAVHTGFNPSGADDWGFKNNTVTWQDNTQIEAIKALTDSIGAFIITEPNSIGAGLPIDQQAENHKILYIRPKYNYPPWHWNSSSSHWGNIWGSRENGADIPGNKMVSTELAMEVSRSNESKADYNAVMVMGTLELQEANGASSGFPVVEVYRKGVGENFRVYAPDIVDEKLQTAPACSEIGRMTLCETGFWLKHTIKLYSLRYPNSTDETIPALCWPGDFIQVQEHNRKGKTEKKWYGDVEAVQVDVAVNNGAVYVTQTLGINEYVG